MHRRTLEREHLALAAGIEHLAADPHRQVPRDRQPERPEEGDDHVAEHEVGRRIGVPRAVVQPLDRVLEALGLLVDVDRPTENRPSWAPAWLGSHGSTRMAEPLVVARLRAVGGQVVGVRLAVRRQRRLGIGKLLESELRRGDEPEVVHRLAGEAGQRRSGRTRSAPPAGCAPRRPRSRRAARARRSRSARTGAGSPSGRPAGRARTRRSRRRARPSGRPARRGAAARGPAAGGSRPAGPPARARSRRPVPRRTAWSSARTGNRA